MSKRIQILRGKFKKYNIDGYIVPKNDDYFTEYSKINRLNIISNFSGSAGLAIILKKKIICSLMEDIQYKVKLSLEIILRLSIIIKLLTVICLKI
jgi:Xaa-Pro aminopeptidase